MNASLRVDTIIENYGSRAPAPAPAKSSPANPDVVAIILARDAPAPLSATAPDIPKNSTSRGRFVFVVISDGRRTSTGVGVAW